MRSSMHEGKEVGTATDEEDKDDKEDEEPILSGETWRI